VINGANNKDALSREFRILNQYGIHARPAALFVKTASRFDSDIVVEKDGNSVSGKSIMGLMTLEAGRGTVLRVTANGDDGEEALDHLEELIVKRKFDED
jgi:phosphocarrier protein HPr